MMETGDQLVFLEREISNKFMTSGVTIIHRHRSFVCTGGSWGLTYNYKIFVLHLNIWMWDTTGIFQILVVAVAASQ